MPMRALFRGAGWGFERLGTGEGETGDFLEGEERIVRADRPEQLPDVLAALDEIAESGNPDLIAVGFVSYEAGVFLEGSTALVRQHEFLPFAEFFIFNTRRSASTRSVPPPPAAPAPFTFEEPARAQRVPSSDEWKRGVETIREGIARGDVYQVNLSRRMRFAARVEPFVFARALYADNPVPFAVLLVEADWAVVSNSPELFLDVDLAQRRAVTKPIKGTIARGATEPEDALRRRDLLASAKDAAENVMIVDLLRNDLGKVAEPGRVETTAMRVLKSFRHLHPLESTVEARLRQDVRLSAVLRATLPGGSPTAGRLSTSRSGRRSSARIQWTITREAESCGTRARRPNGARRRRSREN